MIGYNPTNLAYKDEFTEDSFMNYFAVIESAVENPDVKIEKQVNDPNTGLSFLRFTTCLQTFNQRNRNRRLWTSAIFKQMMVNAVITEMLLHGFPGENGHPVPPTGECTIERLLTIDPNNISHKIVEMHWPSDNSLYGTIETLDDGVGGPGYKFMRHILQGLDPAFSLRSLVPQRKNVDGTIDVTGPGRFITYDRVFVPSHAEAYIDKSFPVKNVVTLSKFQTVMESYVGFVMEKSEKVNRIIDGMNPVMESATLDKNGILSVKTEGQHIFICPENKYRQEIGSFMKSAF